MRWNSMVPMAWVLTDRGTLTQPERTNQSYSRRLSDQDNNRVIEKAKNCPGSSKERNDQVPADGSLWWLNVTTLWVSTLYYFVWHNSNNRRQNPSERQHRENISSGFEPRSVFLNDSLLNWRSRKCPVSMTCRGWGLGWCGRGGWLGWSSFDGHISEEATLVLTSLLLLP